MRMFWALMLIVGCYVFPLSSQLNYLQMAGAKCFLSFCMAIAMMSLSKDKWSERIVYVELCFLAVSFFAVSDSLLKPIIEAHYGNIVIAGFTIELLLWLDGAILYLRNNPFLYGRINYESNKGSK